MCRERWRCIRAAKSGGLAGVSETEATDLTELGDQTFGYDVGNLGKGTFEGSLECGETLETLYRSLQSIHGIIDAGMDISPNGVME